MQHNEVPVSAENLQTFAAEIFRIAGMNAENADFCARCLVQTNLWGIDSHGILRLPRYTQRLSRKVIAANPKVTTIRGSGAFEVMHGDDGMGYLVGRAAMQRANHLARTHGVGMVGVVRSNHFGAAALFAKMAADQGLVGIAMTNVVPKLIMPGASKPITGNNPLAVAAPTAEPFPFMLDISLSAVAGGKLLLAGKKGEKIPLDWATDVDGRPTDDPYQGAAGYLLPLGGHKGFGLSLVVDLLCGVITGGMFQFGVKNMNEDQDDPSLTSHMMMAIDPAAIMSPDELTARMAQFYKTIKTTPLWDDSKEMFLPGEIEYRTQQKRLATGIPLPPALFADLNELGAKLGADTALSVLSARAQ